MLTPTDSSRQGAEEIGEKLFEFRDYTPIPLILLALFVASPSAASAAFGTLIIVFGELIRIYSVAFIGSISRTRKSHTGDNLIDSGPFQYVRNPLYVGNYLIVLGLGIFVGPLWFIIFSTVLFAVQYFYIVKYEEHILRGRFGERYERYCQQVPPWFPRKLPVLAEIEWPDDFSPAIRSEKRTLTSILVLIAILSFIK